MMLLDFEVDIDVGLLGFFDAGLKMIPTIISCESHFCFYCNFIFYNNTSIIMSLLRSLCIWTNCFAIIISLLRSSCFYCNFIFYNNASTIMPLLRSLCIWTNCFAIIISLLRSSYYATFLFL
jgi:hypothetical protein